MGPDPAGLDPAGRQPVLPVLEAVLTANGPSPALTPPGLIWALDFDGAQARAVISVEPGGGVSAAPFRWVHLNLADQWAQRWITEAQVLPPPVRELLLSAETNQREAIADGFVACVLHDIERDFDQQDTARTGALRFALGPGLMVSARLHPLCTPDVVIRRIERGARAITAAAALDLLVGSIAQVIGDVARDLTTTVQMAEDELLDEGRSPNPRRLTAVRRRAVQLHRQLTGLRAVFQRLEEDEDLPEDLALTVGKLAQRFGGLDSDVASLQAQLRALADEMDSQATSRTNQNLYVLSILTALMLPATLVTGLFGMNTGGLPFASHGYGTLAATILAAGSAFGVYVLLRMMGFFRR